MKHLLLSLMSNVRRTVYGLYPEYGWNVPLIDRWCRFGELIESLDDDWIL